MGVWGITDGHIGWGVFAREVVLWLFMIEGALGTVAGGVQVGTNSPQGKESCTKISDNVLTKVFFGQRLPICFRAVFGLSESPRPIAFIELDRNLQSSVSH